MSNLQKWTSLLLCVCMLAGVASFATAEVTQAVPSTAAELQDDTLVATVNGDSLTWAALKETYESLVGNYGSYYDMTTTANINLFRAVALENAISEVLMLQQAKTSGLDQLSEEAIAEVNTTADADWAAAIDNYIQGNYQFTDETTDEEKAQALTVAEAYYGEMGYSQEVLRTIYQKYEIFDRVKAAVTQDAVVTDEEIEAAYQEKVVADQELYGNDITAYIEYNNYVDETNMYAMLYGSGGDMEYAWYRPAGFRAVKHILLPVDETLMNEYKNLQSKLEEQMDAEAAAVQGEEPAEAVAPESAADTAPEVAADAAPEVAAEAAADAAPEATSQPVTPADVDQAKANILASLSEKIDEINQKIADGVSFDELITIYGVKADGSPSDPGMVTEPYMTNGYEVAAASSNYVREFVDAAFSVNNVGEVSAPYLSDFGVHIVKYIADVPAGPVEMTPEQREASRTALLANKQADMFSAQLTAWRDAAQIEYAGVIPSMAEIEKLEAESANDELEALLEEDAEEGAEAGAEEAPQEEVSQEEAPQDEAPQDEAVEPAQ